jgi:hypothetical protein
VTDIDAGHEKVSPMGRLSQQECLARFNQLGFKDPVEFRIKGRAVSSLVFLDQ